MNKKEFVIRSTIRRAALLCIVFLLIMALTTAAYAKAPQLHIDGPSRAVTGDKVVFTPVFSGMELGSAECTVTYDDRILEFTGGSGGEISGGSGVISASVYDLGSEELKFSLEFTVKGEGESSITCETLSIMDADMLPVDLAKTEMTFTATASDGQGSESSEQDQDSDEADGDKTDADNTDEDDSVQTEQDEDGGVSGTVIALIVCVAGAFVCFAAVIYKKNKKRDTK